jgi:hypothetical protein
MKGGKPSVSPWGKPIKDGFKTVERNCKKQLMTQYVWIHSLHTLLHSLYCMKEDMGAFEPKKNPNLKATSLRPPMGINNSLDP